MKRILFPTDFSETATNAFVHALEFANSIGGELVLLHAFDLPIFDSQYFPENYMLIYESIELAQFEHFKDELPKLRAIAQERNLEGIKMTHRLMDGGLMFAVEKSVKEDNIDYVIMGTEGATGWVDALLGTNTTAVISDTTIPVFSVPANAKFKAIKNIAFTTRFRPKDKKALKKVLKLAKKLEAKVKCLYIKTDDSDVTKETIKEWENEFLNEPIEFHVVLNEEVKESILDFIMFKKVDIVVMLTYKRGFFENLFHHSLTKDCASSLDIPVLAIPIE
ncbi:universal stress protein [Flavobacterium seoulense]|uniref:Universal stress protein UspA n=1 Tax=Flavobacterium seoulense TaxID=1492738 RepID=A0A066WU03_9FLAO|nr:universal stress protein [Flavobacterium seoulense]KDN54160.1 universal stress protein UspA [Flavobacterium seoulense]